MIWTISQSPSLRDRREHIEQQTPLGRASNICSQSVLSSDCQFYYLSISISEPWFPCLWNTDNLQCRLDCILVMGLVCVKHFIMAALQRNDSNAKGKISVYVSIYTLVYICTHKQYYLWFLFCELCEISS